MPDDGQLRERFGSFYGLNQSFLYGYARSRCDTHDNALDLLQDSLTKIWNWWVRNPDKTEDDLKPVLCKIISQTAIDRSRASKTRNHVILAGDHDAESSTGFLENVAEDEPVPDVLTSHPDLAQKIRQAIELTKNKCQRELLKLYYLSDEEPTLKQVAYELGIKSSSVNTIHRRALQALKKSLLALAQEMNIKTKKS